MLYNINDKQLYPIHLIEFTNEKELQSLCEENLEQLLNLEFIATEFSIEDYRIDTFAYDKEANAFVLIEYKNTKINSVVDQGIAYLSTMLNNKAHFVLKFSQARSKVYDIKDINWEQSKIIFISPYFTQYQLGAVNFQGMPIELWKIKKFVNNSISFEQIGTSTRKGDKPSASANVNEIFNSDLHSVNNPIKEIKTYSEEEHLKSASENIKDLYTNLRDFILSENEEIKLKANKQYIGFYRGRSPLISITVYKNTMSLWINDKFSKIDDPQGIIKDVSNIGHYGVGDCEIKILNSSNIGYIQDILRKHLQNKI